MRWGVLVAMDVLGSVFVPFQRTKKEETSGFQVLGGKAGPQRKVLKCIAIILLLAGKRTLVIVFPHFMHAVPLGKPSTGPLHPGYVFFGVFVQEKHSKKA